MIRTSTIILTAATIFLFYGCGDQAIEPPSKGGKIVHVGGDDYSVVVRYRTGEVISASATLVDKGDFPKLVRSVDDIFTFNIKNCGYLKFVELGYGLPAILMAGDAYMASQQRGCPIHFGAVENEWRID
jgi:hypothetical protein